MKLHGALIRAFYGASLAAIVAWLAAVPAAQATTYPVAGGNGFTTGTEGWTGLAASCVPSGGSACTETNAYSATQGNPAGSLESRMDVIVNVGGIFSGQATWRSPSFTPTQSGTGSLRYDRQLDVAGLASFQPSATVEAVIVDETTGSSSSLGSETLSSANSTFATKTFPVSATALVSDHVYHLELRSTTTTATAQLGITGGSSVRYDNVALTVNGGAGHHGHHHKHHHHHHHRGRHKHQGRHHHGHKHHAHHHHRRHH